ncbi:hypothetical protein Tdes44962_MAKER05549 [Teratosphaeria destructans]|uniref:PPPDE domain-containing protein n=1 Tax=Teratosphaeria destructans TaxID=418781 RepID=A0A9W7SK62_9PEZI|nr:hypothetical protein Tdes44962_MAKER05549 [Teratosphaeria destructans]
MYLPNTINHLLYSPPHENAPHLDHPLTEHNAARHPRPIILKMRKVRGKTGWLLRRYGHHFGAPKDDPEGVAHRALQVGPYVYELTREEGLVGQRLQGSLIWPSTIGERVVGWTDLSDEEVRVESLRAQAFVRSRNGGKYHIRDNNCQTFIADLLQRLAGQDSVFDASSSDTAGSTDAGGGADRLVASKNPVSSLSETDTLNSHPMDRVSLELARVARIVLEKVVAVKGDKSSVVKRPQLVVTTTEVRCAAMDVTA